MIICEECQQTPLVNCHVCEELTWLHQFRLKSTNKKQPGLENRADFGRPGEPCLEEEE